MSVDTQKIEELIFKALNESDSKYLESREGDFKQHQDW